jgi:MFS family permease
MKNIHKIYIISVLSNLSFGYSLWMLYLQDFGLTLFEVSILQSILNLAMFIFEVPTGLIADKYGEKKSIVFACFLLFIYALLLGISPSSILVQGIGFFLAGIAYALFSGANESLLYKSIIKYNLHSQETKIFGINNAMCNWSLVLAISIGGVISNYSFRAIFYMMALVFLTAFLMSLFLDNINKIEEKHDNNDYIENDTSLIKSLKNLRTEAINIFAFSIIIALVSLFIIYGQEIISEQTNNKTLIGFIFSLALMIQGVSNMISYQVKKILTLKLTLALSLFLMCGSLILLFINSLYAFVFCILLVNLIFGILDPQIISYINSVCSDKYRTTINSIFNSLSTILMMILGPILVWSTGEFDYKLSYIFSISSIFILLISIFLILFFGKRKNNMELALD